MKIIIIDFDRQEYHTFEAKKNEMNVIVRLQAEGLLKKNVAVVPLFENSEWDEF